MRATTHNGRSGKNGIYSPKHNDRNFNLDNAEHIVQDKSCNNVYWHRYQSEGLEMTFEDVEKKFYQDNFTDSLNAKNERYKKSGHKERMKTVDEYRQNKLSCPEETILQIGNKDNTIDPKLLKTICMEHITWEMDTFPNVKVLNAAIHVDEQGAPHMHERKVWVAHTKDGLAVGQAKALDEMGIKRPDTNKKKDRYNNPKTTYTAMCREHFIKLCQEHGLDIELEPDTTSKRGLDLQEYKGEQERKKAQQAIEQAKKAEQQRLIAEQARIIAEQDKRQSEAEKEEAEEQAKKAEQQRLTAEQARIVAEQGKRQAETEKEEAEKRKQQLEMNNKILRTKNINLSSQNAQKQQELDSIKESIKTTQNTLKTAQNALQRVQEQSQGLKDIQSKIKIANKQLEQILDMKVRASEINKPILSFIKQNRDTITYDKPMIEKIQAISHEAYEHMQEAQTRERELDDRESKIKNKEDSIQPLYNEAKKTRDEADEYKNKIKEYIIREAQNIAKNMLNKIPTKPKEGIAKKMYEFMSRYTIKNMTMDKLFDLEQQEERQRRIRDLEDRIKDIKDDWSMEL